MIYGADIDLAIDLRRQEPELVISLSGVDLAEYYRVLDEGYSSEIIFTVRTRNKNLPFALQLSDRRIVTIRKRVVKEYLTGMYIISENGTEKAFESRKAFSEEFFSCRTEIPEQYFRNRDFIIEAKASADLIRRPQPLSLLDPFFTSEITATGWSRLGD